jgi:hypothetical protein
VEALTIKPKTNDPTAAEYINELKVHLTTAGIVNSFTE